jgi:hypothetical protein
VHECQKCESCAAELVDWVNVRKGRQSQMLRHAHFDMKGGLRTFAAGANDYAGKFEANIQFRLAEI